MKRIYLSIITICSLVTILYATGTNLTIKSSSTNLSDTELSDYNNPQWQKQPGIPILLNRTPRLYETDPVIATPDPDLTVKSIHNQNQFFFYLKWKDKTFDSMTSYGKMNEYSVEYAQKSRQSPKTLSVERFADAAAIQIASGTSTAVSIIMGDPQNPVDIYYWKNGVGNEHLVGMGRTVVEREEKISFSTKAQYLNGYWSVVFSLPLQLQNQPIAFAIWDGGIKDRNGQKYYSIWYQLSKE